MPKKNYIGNKYGKLIVLSFHGYARPNNKDSLWLCQCNCGETKITRIRTLKNGQTKTCGKCPKPVGNQHPEWEGYGELSKHLYNTYKYSAEARGLEFNVSIKYLWELFVDQEGKCALTGWDLHFPKTYKDNKNKTASPDRINSSKGYIKGNIQWIHQDVNYLKSNLDEDYFIKICKAVANYR